MKLSRFLFATVALSAITLADAARAQEEAATGHTRGKIVLSRPERRSNHGSFRSRCLLPS
jgi:hypothetical protein